MLLRIQFGVLAILHNILCGFGHVRGGLKSSIGLLNHKERASKSKGKLFLFFLFCFVFFIFVFVFVLFCFFLILWGVVGRRASDRRMHM